MQLLAKFKKNSVHGAQRHLKFQRGLRFYDHFFRYHGTSLYRGATVSCEKICMLTCGCHGNRYQLMTEFNAK